MRPPAIALWILEHFVPEAMRDGMIGDLVEHFHRDIVPRRSRIGAWLWFWRETLRAPIALPVRDPSTGDGLMSDLVADLRFALRLFARKPAFTALVVLTLALGIGANAAIFSVVNAVLLRPLPYRYADRTMLLWNTYDAAGRVPFAVAPPEYFDLKEQLRSFDEVAAVTKQQSPIIGDGGEPEQLIAYVVTPNLFDLLGATTQLGRGFRAEDGAPSSEKVVLLSHSLWMRRFGGDPAILGRNLNIGGRVRTVIGVMPSTVRFPDHPISWLRERADLWLPTNLESSRGEERGNQYLAVLARLRAEATPAQAAADLAVIRARFRGAYPERYASATAKDWKITPVSLRDQMIGTVRPVLTLLAGAVCLVLLIACVNVANLLLARGQLRQREMAVRLALGAARRRLLRQLLTESAVLAAAGGTLGLVLARVGVPALIRLDGGQMPLLADTRVDGAVLAFVAIVSLVTGLLVGVAPALQQSHAQLRGALGEGTGGAGDGRQRRRARSVLVVAQVAMALIVLVAAGLLGRSFMALERVEPGFTPRDVMTLQVSVPRVRYDSAYKIANFALALQARLSALPGVTVASAVYPLPMGGDGWGGSYWVEGEAENPNVETPHAEYTVALPRYFRAMGIALKAGREFTDADVRGLPKLVIVDETLARRHWGSAQNAVGKRLNPNGNAGDWATVVGVVAHVRVRGPQEEGEGQIYQPMLQRPQTMMSMVVRSSGSLSALGPALRDAAHAVDRDVPVTALRAMDDVMSVVVARQRFNMLMLAVFATAALVLATVGLYGVMSYLVSQRTREIGIRIALGGQPRDVRVMVVRESLLIAASGVAIGTVASLAVSGLLRGMLFGIQPTDWATYAAVAGLLLVVSLGAAYGPARRATRIDPVSALRE